MTEVRVDIQKTFLHPKVQLKMHPKLHKIICHLLWGAGEVNVRTAQIGVQEWIFSDLFSVCADIYRNSSNNHRELEHWITLGCIFG